MVFAQGGAILFSRSSMGRGRKTRILMYCLKRGCHLCASGTLYLIIHHQDLDELWGSLNLTHQLVNKLGDLSVNMTKVKTKLPIQRSIYKLWWPTYLLSILNLERARGQWLVWCSWGHTKTTARLTEFLRGCNVQTPLFCSVGFALTRISLLLFLRWP